MAGHRLLLIVGFVLLLGVGVLEIRASRDRPGISPAEAFYLADGSSQTDESCEAAGGAVGDAPDNGDSDAVETGDWTIAYRGSECMLYSEHVHDSPTEEHSVPRICCFDSLGFTPRPH